MVFWFRVPSVLCCSMSIESDIPLPKRMKSVCEEEVVSPKRFWELKRYGMKRPKAIWEEGLVLTPSMTKDYFSILSDLESCYGYYFNCYSCCFKSDAEELDLYLKTSIEEDERYLEQSCNLSIIMSIT
ncbi:hypothetical protein P8452_00722 [Trifolium repens]|nr:hypothetical protein P8452_00722 [Trifolium repens]